jgi:hypothetical protein
MEQIIAHTPPAPDIWNTPWTGILTLLFPSSNDYMVIPRGGKPISGSLVPDFIFEVAKGTFAPGPSGSNPILSVRTVLVIEVKDPKYWDHGKEVILQQLRRETDAVFSVERSSMSGIANQKVYWIGAIGPHWVYGEKEHGQDVRPLIEWHDSIFDEPSHSEFLRLVELVGSL